MPLASYQRSILMLGVVALLATGCGDDKPRGRPPALSPSAAAPKPAVAPQAAPVASAESELADAYIYTPVGKRDPFRSAYKGTKEGEDGAAVPRTPLQRFEIDQLKLIAVITGISRPRAMVETPDGKGYAVKVGTRIGKNLGRIVRIKNKEIIVAEDYRDWNGRKVTNYIHMSFIKEDEGDR